MNKVRWFGLSFGIGQRECSIPAVALDAAADSSRFSKSDTTAKAGA